MTLPDALKFLYMQHILGEGPDNTNSKVQLVSEWLINQNFRYQFSLIRPMQSPPKHQLD
jgi:hypothetical protein